MNEPAAKRTEPIVEVEINKATGAITSGEVKQEGPAKPPERLKEVVIDLTTPVMAHGELVKKLTFRRPTGGDIMSIGEGYPININWQTGQITPNPPVMGEMMVLLAAVPPSTIKALDAEDWSTCAHALMRFFPPGSQAMQY